MSQNRTKPRLIVLSGLQLKGQGSNLKYGELGEWFMPTVLKTVERQRSVSSNLTLSANIRALSSAGRAPDLHSGGQEFDPPRVHQFNAGML